jgi:hypothetical protein
VVQEPGSVSGPIFRGAIAGANSGLETVPLTLPSERAAGDLLFAWVQQSSNSTNVTDDATKGWTRLADIILGTRRAFLFVRTYNPADAASVYTLTRNGASNAVFTVSSIGAHGVDDPTDLIVGPVWRRADNGGAVNIITMPSITTTSGEWLALGFTGEATTSVNSYTVTANAGFTLAAQRTADANIEEVTTWRKAMASAGATGAHSITYSGTGVANGAGLQVGIPPAAAAAAPSTGQIGAHLAIGPSSDRLTIGVDKLGGTTVTAILLNAAGTTELDRETVTNDSTSGWGHAQFTGVAPATAYSVEFDVDGTRQTDVALDVRTLPTSGSFVAIAGSCQFTGSNHPVWDRIREESPVFLAHMGDLHYGDATTAAAWRAAMESSLTAPRFADLLETVPINWTPDNHDRIITNPTGTGTGLNLGETDPATISEWRKMAGDIGWATPLTLGRTWVAGRVRFIQTDGWAVRDDGDGDPAPRTFLGAAQKQWFKDTLDASTEPMVVWFTQWTTRNHANGRWNSFPEESAELEAFINARPSLKRRMVLIGGDSHSMQADSGVATNSVRMASSEFRFKGIPSLNMSGFNRSSDDGDGATAGAWNIGNESLRTAAQPEADWGGYSRMRFTDRGPGGIDFRWQAVRVGPDGATNIMRTFYGVFGNTIPRAVWADGIMETPLTVYNRAGTVETEVTPVQ